MLVNLHVKNFALIDEAEIDFTEGMNVLTGETGAGKSILIDAVSACLGLRISPDVIQKGSDSAYVELVFSVPEPEKQAALETLGVSTEYDCIVISRKILPGRSIHKINDETVTSATVRRVTELLLDIHGQHEHQSLLKAAKQRDILDAYAGSEGLLAKNRCNSAYKAFKEAERTLEAFTVTPEERRRKMDFLSFEAEELRSVKVAPGEKEELTDSYRKMTHFDKIRTALSEVQAEIGSDRDSSAGEAVSRALRALGPVSSFGPELASLQEELRTIEALLQEACGEADSFLEANSFDDEQFRQVENRLDLIHHLESKYGRDASELEECLKKREEELQALTDYEENEKKARLAYEAAGEELKAACAVLHELRVQTAPLLEEKIVKAMSELNFLSVYFLIDIQQGENYGSDGADSIRFLVSLNPGQDPKPLEQVASGGELSRIMLAIKTVLANKDDIPTVIFDEVDTGISGRTAQMVGRKLKEISACRQVLLITHLPQIAAMAKTHIGISKEILGSRTVTSVKVLNDQESLAEIGRLLGGMTVTESVLETARQLKAQG